MLRYLGLGVDLVLVALSAPLAVLIRDNFVPYHGHLEAVLGYAVIAVGTCAVAFVLVGVHKIPWRYISFTDFLSIIPAVTIGVLLAVFLSFLFSRLEGVARSVPAIQWLLIVVGMVGLRVAVRSFYERSKREREERVNVAKQHVLLVGLSHLTELYLQSVAEYASSRIEIVGILSAQRELQGGRLRFQKILGRPEELLKVMTQLEVHGVSPNRIVVMQAFEELSPAARDALLAVEQGSTVRVDWLVERLGLTAESETSDLQPSSELRPVRPQVMPRQTDSLAVAVSSYLSTRSYLKRGFDMAVSLVLLVFLTPLILILCLLVVFDVGPPLVFWQKRPGRFGRPFKLFKFRTMRAVHDAKGRRLSDEERSSFLGDLLRRTKLDELPQLYNILLGEMSFVGPRPLLPGDQPGSPLARLLVQPGLTGFAQVHGESEMAPEDKNVLDMWYVRRASPWLDAKILLRTLIVMVRGERVNHQALRIARGGLESAQAKPREALPSAGHDPGPGKEDRGVRVASSG